MTKILVTLAAGTFASLASTAYADPSVGPAYTASTVVENVSDFAGRRPSLENIVRNWDQYGFIPPTKPAQMIVNGRNGVSISGIDYAAALSILRRGGVTREGRSAATGTTSRRTIRH